MPQPNTSEKPQPLISLNEGEQKIVKTAGFAIGSLLLGWLGFRVVRGVIGKIQSNHETRKSLDKNDPAFFATQLYLAMDGPGTYEENIRQVFRELKSWNQYKQVATSYKRKYGTSLAADLESELAPSEYDEISEIVNALKLPKDRITPQHLQAWNRRLRSAWDVTCWGFPCTDEDAALSVLRDILKTPDPKRALQDLEQLYQSQNFISLQEEAAGEFSSSELSQWNDLKNQILQS